MTGLALALVLASAGLHTTWNFLAKRIRAEAHDAWLFTALSAIIYAPLALGVIAVQRPVIGARELLFMAGTAVLHTAYFLLLLGGYRAGGLSLVYPDMTFTFDDGLTDVTPAEEAGAGKP